MSEAQALPSDEYSAFFVRPKNAEGEPKGENRSYLYDRNKTLRAGKFDIILTNPPFGSVVKRTEKGEGYLEQFDLRNYIGSIGNFAIYRGEELPLSEASQGMAQSPHGHSYLSASNCPRSPRTSALSLMSLPMRCWLNRLTTSSSSRIRCFTVNSLSVRRSCLSWNSSYGGCSVLFTSTPTTLSPTNSCERKR